MDRRNLGRTEERFHTAAHEILNYRIPPVDTEGLHTFLFSFTKRQCDRAAKFSTHCFYRFITLCTKKKKKKTSLNREQKKTFWFICLSRAEIHSFRLVSLSSPQTLQLPKNTFSHCQHFLNQHTTDVNHIIKRRKRLAINGADITCSAFFYVSMQCKLSPYVNMAVTWGGGDGWDLLCLYTRWCMTCLQP